MLWRRGPRTVREIQDELGRRRGTGYTTALKLLQIMHEKGLVSRDESSRSHIYRARIARAGTERRLVKDLVDRAFGGSAAALVMHALSAEQPSAAEVARIRELLDSLESEP